jgi:hypothetical protein
MRTAGVWRLHLHYASPFTNTTGGKPGHDPKRVPSAAVAKGARNCPSIGTQRFFFLFFHNLVFGGAEAFGKVGKHLRDIGPPIPGLSLQIMDQSLARASQCPDLISQSSQVVG